MKKLIKNIIKEEINDLESENGVNEFVQFTLDGVLNELRKKCLLFLNDINLMHDEYEVDYESVDLCSELFAINSIKVLRIEETTYYFNLDVAFRYSSESQRTVGYGRDHLIAEIEEKMKKYFSKQVHIYPEDE